MADRTVFKAAIEKYGVANQINQLCEECAELIVAMNHARRGRITAAEVVTELVDVEIMLEQMKMIYCRDEWARQYAAKIERLKNRITGGSDGTGKQN